MKLLSTLLTLTSAAFVVSQTTTSSGITALPSGVPVCAISCATLFLSSNSQCSSSDTACLCKSSSFLSSAANCIVSSCTSTSDQQAAYQYAVNLCSSAGVTLPSFSQLQAEASSASNTATATKTGSNSSSATATSFSSDARQQSSIFVNTFALLFCAGLGLIFI